MKQVNLILPDRLDCPYCKNPMNLTGNGQLAGTKLYTCLVCAGALQRKEMHAAQVIEWNGSKGRLQLSTTQAYGMPEFTTDKVRFGTLRLGDYVLVFLEPMPQRGMQVRALWKVKPAPVQNGNPQRKKDGNRKAHSPARITGVLTRLLPSGNDGFLTTEQSGESIYFHRNNLAQPGEFWKGRRFSFIAVPGKNGRRMAVNIRPL